MIQGSIRNQSSFLFFWVAPTSFKAPSMIHLVNLNKKLGRKTTNLSSHERRCFERFHSFCGFKAPNTPQSGTGNWEGNDFLDIQISMFFLKLLKNYFHPKWMVSQLKLFRVSVSFVWKISWENLTRQKLQKHLNSVCCPQQDL